MAKVAQLDLLDVMFHRTAFDGRQAEVSKLTSIDFGDEKSLTQQEFKDECDVNNIMARYEQTGVGALDMLQEVLSTARFGDCTVHEDYHASMNFVAAAGEAFDALPAKIRARFDNDPAKMLKFLDDKENTDEAIRLGLLPAPKVLEGDEPPAPTAKAAQKPSTAPVGAKDAPTE